VVLLIAPAFCNLPIGSISGRVKVQNAKDPTIKVCACPVQQDSPQCFTFSPSPGSKQHDEVEFKFLNLSYGTWIVKAKWAGYKDAQSKEIYVGPTDTKEVNPEPLQLMQAVSRPGQPRRSNLAALGGLIRRASWSRGQSRTPGSPPLPAPVPTPVPRFDGIIRDEGGQPIAGAAFRVICLEGEADPTTPEGRAYQLSHNTIQHAGEKGQFTIGAGSVCRTGDTLLMVSHPGYQPDLVTMTPATSRTHDIILKAAQTRLGDIDAARRTTLDAQSVNSIPLPGIRTFDSLALLSPGVLPPQETNNGPGPGISASVGTAGQFVVNGIRSRDNNFTVDGSDNNEEDVGVRRQGFVALVPQSIDSISEFQIVTVLSDARFGRNTGGMINVLSKFGGPALHGSVYGFFNDRGLNARNFFDYSGSGAPAEIPVMDGAKPVLLNGQPLLARNPGNETAPYLRVQSGITLGGAIPQHEQNRRTFFFVSFEDIHIHAAQDSNFSVPTVKQRGVFGAGDTGFWKLGSQSFAMTPDSLPGNAIFSLFPFPNNPAGPYGANTYTASLPANADAALGSIRFDHHFDKGKTTNVVTARYNITDEQSILPVTGGAIFSSLEPRLRTQNLAFYISTNFTPRTSEVVRLSYGRTSAHFDPVSTSGLLPSQLLPGTPMLLNAPLLLNLTTPESSLPNYVSATSATGSAILNSLGYGSTTNSEQITGPLGQVKIAGFSPVGVDVFNFPQTRANNTFQWADTISHFRGWQTFVAGFDIRRTQINTDLNRDARPLIEFGGLLNPQPNFPLPILNAAHCNTLMAGCVVPQDTFSPTTLAAAGVPTGFFQTLAAQPDYSLGIRFTQYDFFLQDEMHLSARVVLTLGVRYELNTVPHTVRNKVENAFDPSLLHQDALSVQTKCPARCGDLAPYFATIPDYSVTFGSDPWGIHPRAGLAWNVRSDGKLVLRTGFGTYSSPSPGVVIDQARSAFPNFVPLNVVNFSIPSNLGSILFNPANARVQALNPYLQVIQPHTLNQLLPGIDPVQLLALNLYGLQGSLSPSFPSLDLVLPAKNLRNPRAYQFGMTIEAELPWGIKGSAAYVGTRGVALFRLTTPDLGLNRSLVAFTNDVVPIVATPPASSNVVFPFFAGAMQPPQSTRISNSFTVAPTVFDSGAGSTYQSLQLELRKSYSRGLEIGTAFTYSHSIDNASDFFDSAGSYALAQDSVNMSERGSSSFDVRLRNVSEVVWDLPFRSQSKWLGSWQIAGLYTAQTGQPYTVNTWYDVNRDGNLTDRLQTTAPLVFGSSSVDRVGLSITPGVNPLALLAEPGSDGAVGRNTFQARGIQSWDAALTKSWNIREGKTIRLRMEIFNLLNHPDFGIPVRILEAPGFGTSFNTTVPARNIQLALKYAF
jgi:hypothetical protein